MSYTVKHELPTQSVPIPEPQLNEAYRPRNRELLTEYEVRIQFLSRGCIIHVGCKSIAFETVESAMKELNAYVTNTYEVQKTWREILNS